MLDTRCTIDERCFFSKEKAQNAQKRTKNEQKRALFLAIPQATNKLKALICVRAFLA
jgi:hypothetical protein